MKRLFLYVCLATTLIACSDNDEVYYPVTQQIQQALYDLYPEAQDVEWGSTVGYLVADFVLPATDLLYAEAEAWFTPSAVWQMTSRDVTYSSLPEAVTQAFELSAYGAATVEDVVRIDRLDAMTIYTITVDRTRLPDISLFYTAEGVLIEELPDDGYDDFRRYLPTTLPTQIATYISRNYPTATVLSLQRRKGATEVDVLDGDQVRQIYFDAMNRWGLTRTELQQSELPQLITLAIDNLYLEYTIDDAALIDSPNGEYYLIEVDSSAGQSTLRISTQGEVL